MFNRNIEPSCLYCRYGAALGCNEVACSKRGIMSGEGFCGAFRYEPTKRQPETVVMRSPKELGLSAEDFSL